MSAADRFVICGHCQFVRYAELTETEEQTVVRYLRQSLGHPFEISIRRVETIPRSPSGKFEDFISLAE